MREGESFKLNLSAQRVDEVDTRLELGSSAALGVLELGAMNESRLGKDQCIYGTGEGMRI